MVPDKPVNVILCPATADCDCPFTVADHDTLFVCPYKVYDVGNPVSVKVNEYVLGGALTVIVIVCELAVFPVFASWTSIYVLYVPASENVYGIVALPLDGTEFPTGLPSTYNVK
jgi:hypothetical protein